MQLSLSIGLKPITIIKLHCVLLPWLNVHSQHTFPHSACEKCSVFFLSCLYSVANNKKSNELSCMGFFFVFCTRKNKQQSLCFCSIENQIDRSKHAHDRINEGKKKYLRGLCYLQWSLFTACFCFEIRKLNANVQPYVSRLSDRFEFDQTAHDL